MELGRSRSCFVRFGVDGISSKNDRRERRRRVWIIEGDRWEVAGGDEEEADAEERERKEKEEKGKERGGEGGGED